MKWNLLKLELNPAFGGGYYQIGLLYNSLGEDAKAEKAFNKAIELDPHVSKLRWGLISLYLAQNQYNKASTIANNILDYSPDTLMAFTYLGYIKHIQNNLSKAYYYLEEAIIRTHEEFFNEYHIVANLQLGAIQWKKGETKIVNNIFSEFLNYAKNEIDAGNESWEIPYNIAGVYSVLGDKDKAFSWLDQAIDAGWREYRIGKIEPLFENIRQDSRFEAKIQQVKGMVDKARAQIKATQK